MRVLAEFPHCGTRRRRYDWDVLLDGRPRELERGVDFDCLPTSLERTIRRAARRRGVRVLVRTDFRGATRDPVVVLKAVRPRD